MSGQSQFIQNLRAVRHEWIYETEARNGHYLDRSAMWKLCAAVDEMVTPVMLDLFKWPQDKKLPRGCNRQALASIGRNVLSAWLLNDPTWQSWKDSSRPVVYVAVTEFLRELTQEEQRLALQQALLWAYKHSSDPRSAMGIPPKHAEALTALREKQMETYHA